MGNNRGMRIAFTKMHGLGNDFVIVDLRGVDAETAAAARDGDRIRALADRRTGIGFDQWLAIVPPAGDAYADYEIFNADGGEVGQCGNGARCIAAWLGAHDALGAGATFALGSAGGPVSARIGDEADVTTTLAPPSFDPASVPLEAEAAAAHYTLELDGGAVSFAALSVGNPHCVIYTGEAIDAVPLAHIADAVDADGRFTRGVNVGVARVTGPDSIDLRVRERGVGETRACGTGAAAAAVVGVRDEHVSAPVSVRLPGGVLVVDWRRPGGEIRITGPAATVFEGFVTL